MPRKIKISDILGLIYCIFYESVLKKVQKSMPWGKQQIPPKGDHEIYETMKTENMTQEKAIQQALLQE